MSSSILALRIEDVERVAVGPGCFRRDLPSSGGVRVWVVDMEPGAEWPHVDVHDQEGEELYVISGEVIEGNRAFTAGTYVRFGPHSEHRPRTKTGVRLFGLNAVSNSKR